MDSRHLQRCADNGHRSLAHASVHGKPIREKGQFGYVDTPFRDADWSVEYSVGLILVGNIRIDYLKDPVDRGQSTDAAPLTELVVFYTLLHLYNYCAAGSPLCWTFCDTVCKTLSVEELSLCCSVFPMCQMMEGAALVDDRSGVTFDIELCIPWHTPEAVVDINLVEVVTLGSSRPMRRMSEVVGDGPLLTVQNPADMVGETVIDCRPSVLPVSIPLSALSPRTVDRVREISGLNPPQETGQSIMDMDTNEITIHPIVGFQWDKPRTDVEDELPTPTSSPAQDVAPVIPPMETADSLDRGDGFNLDLAKVMLDVSVMPALISPIEESEVPPTSKAAEYAAPETPVLETVIESPGYAVPGELTFSWVPGYVPVPGQPQ